MRAILPLAASLALALCAPVQAQPAPTAAAQPDIRDLSYGELAKQSVPPLLDALVGDLGGLGPQTLPHEAKDLRKRVGALRLQLDLFVFAYPRGAGFDPWRDIRRELDEGYELIGAFKDLYDAQGVADPSQAVYDPLEVSDLRGRALAWKQGFTRAGRLAFVRYYLEDPKPHRLYDRKAKDLSPYFWGIGLEPRRQDEGIETLARLLRGLLAQARDDLREVEKIKDDELVVKKNQEHFHGFRKAVRGAVKVAELFPEVFARDAAAELTFLDGVVDRYGAINDHLVAHELAAKRGQRAEARRLEREVETEWDELERWQRAEALDEVLRDARRKVQD
ncbi:MAG: hypothetical protein AB7N76_26190 [Planctomycetota bacterium]